jgi:hypothetical protein
VHDAHFDVERVSIVHVVTGTNGEDLIRAEGKTGRRGVAGRA